MRMLTPILVPLLAGLALTFSPAAAAQTPDPADTVLEKPAGDGAAPALEPLRPERRSRSTPLIQEIVAPAQDATSGASAPPGDPDAPLNETDAERAKRIKDKFRQRPGYRENPPEPRA